MSMPHTPYSLPAWDALLGVEDATLTPTMKRDHLKIVLESLSDEGVDVLWPLLRWWVDPVSRTQAPLPSPFQPVGTRLP